MKIPQKIAAVLTLVCCAPLTLHAEPAPNMPNITTEDMAKAQKETTDLFKSDQLKVAAKKAQKQSEETLHKFDPKYSGLDSPNLMLNMPRITPSTLNQRVDTDYKKLTKQFYKGVEGQQENNDLVVFVSLSMPKESLIAIADQSAQYGAVMVFRGIKNNSMKAMMYEMKSIVANNHKVNIQINPVVFTKLDIQQVPTFAIIKGKDLSNGDSQSCAPASAYMSISGNVPMSYALEKIAALAPPDFASIAESHLKQGELK